MERFIYSLDDGSSETSALGNSGLGPRDLFWLNQFTAAPEANFISGISLALGSPEQPAFTIDGDPIVIALYEDPNDDGNPDDAILLATENTQITNPNTDQFLTVEIEPTMVSGSFFVGALLPNQPANFGNGGPVATDTTSPQENRSFFATTSNGSFNLESISENSQIQPVTVGNWLLRAEADVEPGSLDIFVTTTQDEFDGDVTDIFSLRENPGGTGISLREAIAVAQVNSATIILEGNQTYNLTIENSEGVSADNSLLNFTTGNVTIRSLGSEQAIINANQLDRVFTVFDNAELNLENIIVTGGQTEFSGGGIANLGVLRLINSTVSNNSSNLRGGGIFNAPQGALFLTNSVISDNSSVGDGGGIFNDSDTSLTGVDTLGLIDLNQSNISGNTSEANGGGIATYIGRSSLMNSTISGNIALNDGGGIIAQGADSIFDSARLFTITDSVISNNTAGRDGGGFFNQSNVDDDQATIDNSTISENMAGRNGGGILSQSDDLTIIESTISGNSATENGGGLANSGPTGTTRLDTSLVSENIAGADGGGLYNNGASSDVFVVNSTISGNQASGDGGGLDNDGSFTNLVNSTVNNNRANNDGGGVVTGSGASTNLINSTISGNQSDQDGGGLYNRPFLAAIDPLGNIIGVTPGGTTDIFNSTITENAADADNSGSGVGGGIANRRFDNGITVATPGIVDSQNSIVAGNLNDDISGAVNGQNNLVSRLVGAEGSISGDTNILSETLGLGPLEDNGGPTLTHSLLSSSPAINAGDNTLIIADIFDQDEDDNTSELIPFDQRGRDFNRIVNDTIDIGAFEAGVMPPVDPPIAVNLSITPVSGMEAEGSAFTIMATVGAAVMGDQRVDLLLSGGADADDFTGELPTEIEIATGQTTGSVTITVNDDDEDEADVETAIFAIANPSSGLTLGENISIEIMIEDNDPLPADDLPVINLSANSTVGTETNQTEITLTATASAPVTEEQSLDLTLSGDADAADFVGEIPEQVAISAGQTSGSITITVNDDVANEADLETAIFTLSNPSPGSRLGNNASIEVTIADNDLQSMVVVTIDAETDTNNLIDGLIYDVASVEPDAQVTATLRDDVLALGTDAVFDNLIGFYPVNDSNGGIDIDGDGVTDLQPNDIGYARAAIINRVANFEIRAGSSGNPNQNTTVQQFDDVLLMGGQFYAPFVIANGGALGFDGFILAEDSEANGIFNNVVTAIDEPVTYFSFVGANPDGSRHLQAQGNNIFGFEDLSSNLGISDNDFNDAVFSIDFIN